MKYSLLNWLRGIGLLGLMDWVKYWLNRLLLSSSNKEFIKKNPDFPLPPYHLAFDAYNSIDWEKYHSVGRQQAHLFASIIGHECTKNELRVLEWGCGPGRLIRHLSDLLPARTLHLSGTDYNKESISWCQDHLTGMDFRENQLMPPLPFGNAVFDVTYNFSVFTHLSEEAHMEWIEELWRVLVPGGIVVCTTHGRNYTHLLTRESEWASYNSGNLVVQGKYMEGKKWYLAIHPEDFVLKVLLAKFTDIQKFEGSETFGVLQDVWVARKPLAV